MMSPFAESVSRLSAGQRGKVEGETSRDFYSYVDY